jgi:hypothetical protein
MHSNLQDETLQHDMLQRERHRSKNLMMLEMFSISKQTIQKRTKRVPSPVLDWNVNSIVIEKCLQL